MEDVKETIEEETADTSSEVEELNEVEEEPEPVEEPAKKLQVADNYNAQFALYVWHRYEKEIEGLTTAGALAKRSLAVRLIALQGVGEDVSKAQKVRARQMLDSSREDIFGAVNLAQIEGDIGAMEAELSHG